MTAKKDPAPHQLIYDGGVDEVFVRLASGREIRVARGETVELTADEAKPLRNHPDWAEMPDTSKES